MSDEVITEFRVPNQPPVTWRKEGRHHVVQYGVKRVKLRKYDEARAQFEAYKSQAQEFMGLIVE